MHNLKLASLFIIPVLLPAVLFAVLNYLDPATVGPGGILAVFVMIYFLCFSLLYVLLRYGLKLFSVLGKKLGFRLDKQLESINKRRAYLYASVLSLIPIILLAMVSFSQLSIWDCLLVAAFAGISILYIQKTS